MRQHEEILFKDWQWGECLDYLSNIVYHSDNIVLISGEADSGKTTLKQELIRLLPGNFKILSIYGESRSGVTAFMKQITTGFGLPWDSNSLPSWNELQRAILSEIDFNWVLLIDDAQKLSWDSLNALVNLYTKIIAEGSKFSLALFADITLAESIKNSVLKDFFETKFQILELQPLNLEQMTNFLRDNMQLIFDRKTLKKIYNASNGVIGKIKQLAMSELNIKNTGEKMIFKNLAEKITNPLIIRGFVCGSLLLLAFVLFSITQKKDIVAYEQPINHDIAVKDIVGNTQYDKLYQQLHSELTNSMQEQLKAMQQEQFKAMQSEVTKLQETISILSSTMQKSAEKTMPMASVDLHVNNRTLQTNNNDNKLLKIAKNRYVLQLMASHSKISNKIRYFSGKFKPQEDVWFIVVHGVYNSRELALKDIKNLPSDLQKLKPIVRDYASVHKLINNNHTMQTWRLSRRRNRVCRAHGRASLRSFEDRKAIVGS